IRADAKQRRAGLALVMLSADEGKSWTPQKIRLPKEAEQVGTWNEWDFAELKGGNLLCGFRRNEPGNASKQVRWQGMLRQQDDVWSLEDYVPAPFEHSGHP